MRGRLAFLALALLGTTGCFNYSEPICSFSCTASNGAAACPSNYECRTDGYCHKKGSTEACEFSDAAVSADLSATPDLTPAVDMTSTDEGSSPADAGPATDL
jgi:hypothetical protein